MVRRLALVGQRSISLAVDVTNYVMFELGRPIHGYDADKVQGALRHPPCRRGRAADHARRPRPRPVDRGPRGHRRLRDHRPRRGHGWRDDRDVRETTTRVLVEAAHWDAVSMFRTGRRHKLTSEAGKRNERGVDPTICEAAADRVAELLAEHGGGTVEPGVTVVGTPPPRPRSRSRSTCRRGSPASTSRSETTIRAPARRRVRGRRRRRPAHRRRAALASRPDRPLRPRRGGRPRRRLRRGAVGAAAGARRARADPRAAAAPSHRRTSSPGPATPR